MGKSNVHATKQSGGIRCVEVLVSRKVADNSRNILWPLSVYSLENQPVKNAIPDCEVFHFMLYDWKRTIQKELEDNQVPYSIIRFFRAETVHADHIEQKELLSAGGEHHDFSTLLEMEEAD